MIKFIKWFCIIQIVCFVIGIIIIIINLNVWFENKSREKRQESFNFEKCVYKIIQILKISKESSTQEYWKNLEKLLILCFNNIK